ncbi:hypothetical protein POM88_049819 [Heracleum sosnowskyi]|uniref:Uncharacterized protein n=1 Tax=Heracleum sosnowskyi TaxID=360622 RepID=A0AAD8GYU7_9APIA|nr:hypothetical protein POM88_049819 [Heracleum sosnowskyi]
MISFLCTSSFSVVAHSLRIVFIIYNPKKREILSAVYYQEKGKTPMAPRTYSINKRSLAQDIFQNSPGSYNLPKNAAIVMYGLKCPSMELLRWVLKYMASDGTWTITLLVVMPWLNIPLSCKKWSEDVMTDIHNLCRNYGVTPQVITLMGHPLRTLVVERIASLHPTLVVIDRHHDKKDIEFYAEKVPYNIVVMNDHKEYDIIKAQTRLIDTDDHSLTGQSPAPTPEVIINSDGHCMKYPRSKLSISFTKDKKMSFGRK